MAVMSFVGSSPVLLRVRLCPHVSATVNTREEWGVSHRYVFRGYCDVCGPVKHEEFRARDTA